MKCLKMIGCISFFVVLFVVKIDAQKTKDNDFVRVMSFNIRYDEPRDGLNAWTNRKTKVSDIIRFHKADLIGVQEALFGQLKDLASLLSEFDWSGVGRTDGKNDGEFSAILYRKSRFKLLESKTFWLSETPDTAGSRGWDAALPRIVSWGKFYDRQSKKTFYQFNTHFDHQGATARRESARLLMKKATEISGKLPFFVTGDFNAEESSDVYKILTGKSDDSNMRFTDARYASINGHFGGVSTFNAFKELEPNRKIDYIFVKEGVKVLEHGVLSDRWDGFWASDHLPVLAEIAFIR